MKRTIDIPEKEPEKAKSFTERDEYHRICMADGPALARTHDSVRLYDHKRELYIEVSNTELLELLTEIFFPT